MNVGLHLAVAQTISPLVPYGSFSMTGCVMLVYGFIAVRMQCLVSGYQRRERRLVRRPQTFGQSLLTHAERRSVSGETTASLQVDGTLIASPVSPRSVASAATMPAVRAPRCWCMSGKATVVVPLWSGRSQPVLRWVYSFLIYGVSVRCVCVEGRDEL